MLFKEFIEKNDSLLIFLLGICFSISLGFLAYNNDPINILNGSLGLILLIVIIILQIIEDKVELRKLVWSKIVSSAFILLLLLMCLFYISIQQVASFNPALNSSTYNERITQILYKSIESLFIFIALMYTFHYYDQGLVQNSAKVCFNCGSILDEYAGCVNCQQEQQNDTRKHRFDTLNDIFSKRVDVITKYILLSFAFFFIFSILYLFNPDITIYPLIMVIFLPLVLLGLGYQYRNNSRLRFSPYTKVEQFEETYYEQQRKELEHGEDYDEYEKKYFLMLSVSLILISYVLLFSATSELIILLPNVYDKTGNLLYTITNSNLSSCGKSVNFTNVSLMIYFIGTIIFGVGVFLFNPSKKLGLNTLSVFLVIFTGLFYLILYLPLILFNIYTIWGINQIEQFIGLIVIYSVFLHIILDFIRKVDPKRKKLEYIIIFLLGTIVIMSFSTLIFTTCS